MTLLLLLSACTGQSGEEPAIVQRCDVVSDVVVAADDDQLGFTATDALAAVDGRAWGVTWVVEEDYYSGSAIARLTSTALPAGEPHAMELADLDGACPHAGTWLMTPVALVFADEADTFVAFGTATLAAAALADDAMDFAWGEQDLLLDPVPADLATFGEARLADLDGNTPVGWAVALEGRLAALELFVEVDGQNAAAVVAVAALAGE